MGFDKLVDSVKLNGALTATADAIREKNGGSAKIPWDAVKGFADVISALNCVKTGTLTATSGVPSTVRIEGLGFKPSTIILFALVSGVNVSLNENCLYAIFNGNGTTSYYSYTSVEEKEVKDDNGDTYTEYVPYLYMYNSSNAVIITPNDDGFTVTNQRTNGGLDTDGTTYCYYAF